LGAEALQIGRNFVVAKVRVLVGVLVKIGNIQKVRDVAAVVVVAVVVNLGVLVKIGNVQKVR